ncbi:hypothetical protein BP5796_09671 [Coleophoma crateriformis]|uniref:N-acetyltransferase domain-containing protein n=1 Tax=Coleophoma crateriformis TaxID=565419 RepID=A0A3D8QYP6_9HELO|nr:hypothetical protein BP5796_09671 [Coleophoma crateriformis]
MLETHHDPPGKTVPDQPALPPTPITLNGQYCTLTPLSMEHAPVLYEILGGVENAAIWTYIPYGPYADLESFTEYIKTLEKGSPFFTFVIWVPKGSRLPAVPTGSIDAAHARPVGLISYLNIVPEHRSIEIGSVLYSKALQRTTAATEAVYLLIKHCFESLHYLRCEWKANSLNEPSKKAAIRFGFIFEGIFRKHWIVKGRRRDSWWSSMTDEEWDGGIQSALDAWLAAENFDHEGKQKKKLEEFRQGGTVVTKAQ